MNRRGSQSQSEESEDHAWTSTLYWVTGSGLQPTEIHSPARTAALKLALNDRVLRALLSRAIRLRLRARQPAQRQLLFLSGILIVARQQPSSP